MKTLPTNLFMGTPQPSPTFLPFQQDWHKADIIAALHKKGTSLAAESRAVGLSSSTLANALTRPWAKGELLISLAIGVPAETIWPSRYFDVQTKQPVVRQMRTRKPEFNTHVYLRHVLAVLPE